LIGAYGLGLIAVDVFRTDSADGFPPSAITPTHPSWHGVIHALGGLFIFVVLTAALTVFARFFLARKERWWAYYSLASAILILQTFFGVIHNTMLIAYCAHSALPAASNSNAFCLDGHIRDRHKAFMHSGYYSNMRDQHGRVLATDGCTHCCNGRDST
jgi:hypothetical protein